MKKVSIIGTGAAVLSLLVAGPVLAASPANDGYDAREIVAALPFGTTVDTTEATTDAVDAEANLSCGAPATDASVWFEYTAGSDGMVTIDTSGSSYSAGLIVVTGAPGAFNLEACGPKQLAVPVSTGTTYAILVFDHQFDGGGNGGTLQLSIVAPTPPTLDLTVDPIGSFDAKTGAATISGTVTCTGAGLEGEGEGEGKSFVSVEISQLVGRIRISAVGGTEFACDGTTQAWAVELVSSGGKFAGGKATVAAFTFACGAFDCAEDQVTQTVTLRK
jgi:hypothetical protein